MKYGNIVIYGIVPPPYGGVSVHIRRFIAVLGKQNISYTFYSANSVSFQKFLISQLNFRKNIIHIHSFLNWKFQIVLVILKLFFYKKIIVTIHNDRFLDNYNSLNCFKKMLLRLFSYKIDKLISVNPDTKFGFISKSKIEIIPAYINPSDEEISVELPKEILDFRKKHSILLTSNASRIVFHNNQDLYGIDLSIELMKQLIDNGYKNIGFLCVIPEINDIKYFNEMKEKVEKYNLDTYFFFYTKQIDYAAILNISDVFIRPTNTDGDSVSVRESIFLYIPTIVSDVVIRPKGVQLFENRDVSDLFNKTVNVIENLSFYKGKLKNTQNDDNTEKIISIYNQL